MAGWISEKELLESCGIYLDGAHAAINPDGIIEVWLGKPTPPWERSDKLQRHSLKYIAWRNDVFDRDNYICQDCNNRGGELNAHHLKGFSKYKKLRYEVENGITLCYECHRKRHKRLVI